MEGLETLPKDLLQFVENKPERAVEVLREIIDAPDYDNSDMGQLQAQAVPRQAFGGLQGAGLGQAAQNLGWTTTTTNSGLTPFVGGL